MNIVPNSTEMLAFTKERGGTAERLSHSTGRGPDRTDTLKMVHDLVLAMEPRTIEKQRGNGAAKAAP